MNIELIKVLCMLGLAIFLFATNKVRTDVVAILMLTLFVVLGILPLGDTLRGFSDPSVILIGALFIIGDGLVRTGIAYKVGDLLMKKAGNSEVKVLILLMGSVAVLGSVMSSTGVVAIFIPVVMSICNRMGIPPGKLMMPLSIAGLISGMTTLVATAPNLMVNSALRQSEIKGFGFLSITPIGVIVLVAGIIYMIFARKWLVKDSDQNKRRNSRQSMDSLIGDYQVQVNSHRCKILSSSKMVGKTLSELKLRADYGVSVTGIERVRKFGQKVFFAPLATTEIRVNDILFLSNQSVETQFDRFCKEMGAMPLPVTGDHFADHSRQVGVAEITFPPNSSYFGKNVTNASFRNNLNVHVIGMRRKGEAITTNLLDVTMQMGDTLLIMGNWKTIRRLQADSSVIVLNLPSEVEEIVSSMSQAPYALFSLIVMVVLMVTGLLPNVIAALIGCLLMLFFRCIDMESAYKSIYMPTIILIIGMMPFSIALQNTGGIDLAVNGLVSVVGEYGPRVILSGLFLMCAIVGLFISNTVTAVLMAPIAISLAAKMGMSPYPFAMAICVASSAAFMTPVSSPVNSLVFAPGGYKFMDYVKVGMPFTVIVMIITIVVVPILFPFYK